MALNSTVSGEGAVVNLRDLCLRGLVLTCLWVGLTATALPRQVMGHGKSRPSQDKVWLSKPDADALSRVYPPRAASELKSGTAVLKCRIEAGGLVGACVVSGEDPPGYGFGEAALKITPSFRFRAPQDGGPPLGETVNIPVRFNASSLRLPAHANLYPGDAAILMTELKGARPPGRAVVRCTDPDAKSRFCLWALVTWTARPYPEVVRAALEASDMTAGKSLLECSVTASGALADCRVSGDKTLRAQAVLLALAKDFRLAPKAQDGTPVTDGRILIEFNWALMRAVAPGGR